MWWWFTRNATDQAEVEKFRASLWAPPPGAEIPVESPWSPESERAAFASFRASVSPG